MPNLRENRYYYTNVWAKSIRVARPRDCHSCKRAPGVIMATWYSALSKRRSRDIPNNMRPVGLIELAASAFKRYKAIGSGRRLGCEGEKKGGGVLERGPVGFKRPRATVFPRRAANKCIGVRLSPPLLQKRGPRKIRGFLHQPRRGERQLRGH